MSTNVLINHNTSLNERFRMIRIIVPESPRKHTTVKFIRTIKRIYDWNLIYPCSQASPQETREWAKELFIASTTTKKAIFIVTTNEIILRELQIHIATHRKIKSLYTISFLHTNLKETVMNIQDNGFFDEPWPNDYFGITFAQSMELLQTPIQIEQEIINDNY